MPPVTTLLLFWNANPVMLYMYPGGVTYKPEKRKKKEKKRKEESFVYFQHSVREYVSGLSTVSLVAINEH